MNNRTRSDKWAKNRDFVSRRTVELAANYGGADPAIALNEIALQCNIKKVVFRPLLIDGALGYDNGLVMFVKCDSENARQYDNLFTRHGGIGLPPRVRFTIAHEIVHTFFYDTTVSPPRPKVTGAHPQELKSLEQTCDFGAGRLLLPPKRFDQFMGTRNFLHAETISDAARRFGVSLKAFISRLSEHGTWNTERGAVALARRSKEQVSIVMLAVDNFSKRLFHGALESREANDLIYDSRLTIFGGNESRVETQIPCVPGGQRRHIRCVAECIKVHSHSSTFLFTVKLCDS